MKCSSLADAPSLAQGLACRGRIADREFSVGGLPRERAGEAYGTVELERLLQREENRLGGPGSLLDLGCGTGIYALGAAARGWRAVGVDASRVAIEQACEHAAKFDTDARFEVGDVGLLTDLEIPPGSIDLFIDVGCYHGLPQPTRRSVGRGMDALAGAHPSALIVGMDRAPRSIHVGTTTADLERNLQGWTAVDSQRLAVAGMPRFLGRVPFRLFRLSPQGTAG